MHTISHRQSALPGRSAGGFPAPSWLSALVEHVMLWHERGRQRAALASLDDNALKDIGLTRADVFRESHKRFWQD